MLILVCMNQFQLAENPGKEGERNKPGWLIRCCCWFWCSIL